jgi:hypothetical protein
MRGAVAPRQMGCGWPHWVVLDPAAAALGQTLHLNENPGSAVTQRRRASATASQVAGPPTGLAQGLRYGVAGTAEMNRCDGLRDPGR